MLRTYSPRMVRLILEIRLRVPNALKQTIKLANPKVLDQLINHYNKTEHRKLQSLIEDLMYEAGQEWEKKLTIAKQQTSEAETHNTSVDKHIAQNYLQSQVI